MIIEIKPVIDHSVRGLCWKPYTNHPKGCPNAGKCDRCPPKVPFFEDVYDLTKPIYAVVNEFDLGEHVERMKIKQPNWTYRQLSCVLYWQPKARKALKEKVKEALNTHKEYSVTYCPEGMGINVTQTMKNVGVILEWENIKIARQIAFIGVKL